MIELCPLLCCGIPWLLSSARSVDGLYAVNDTAESIIMGADFYEVEKVLSKPHGPLYPSIGIGAGTTIHKAIIDKNTRIGANCRLVNREGVRESSDRAATGIFIRDGILIVSKSSIVPDGTTI